MKWIIRTKSGLFCIQFNFEVFEKKMKEEKHVKFTKKRIKHFPEDFTRLTKSHFLEFLSKICLKISKKKLQKVKGKVKIL